MSDYDIDYPDLGVTLIKTSSACPQQYDLVRTNTPTAILGYFRLRSGRFRVAVPDVGGEIVYERVWDNDPLLGCFHDDDEQVTELRRGVEAAMRWWDTTPTDQIANAVRATASNRA